jgi:hypothetical protein
MTDGDAPLWHQYDPPKYPEGIASSSYIDEGLDVP